eukprot:scaffold63292_cov70-Phaeocystis_antarctica.AAC.2
MERDGVACQPCTCGAQLEVWACEQRVRHALAQPRILLEVECLQRCPAHHLRRQRSAQLVAGEVDIHELRQVEGRQRAEQAAFRQVEYTQLCQRAQIWVDLAGLKIAVAQAEFLKAAELQQQCPREGPSQRVDHAELPEVERARRQ